jgi:dissimilatory sulfite reductase (desulfoviridin) alpha/beta subunit
VLIDKDVEVGRQRDGDVVMICGRCRPDDGEAWARQIRQRLYARLGPKAVTVTVSGCVRSCPAGQVAVVLAGREGCREWAVEPARLEQTERLVEGLVSLSTS